MTDVSTRFGIVEPSANRIDSADVPLYIRNVVAALEAFGAQFSMGTQSSTPSPGVPGRFRFTTDTKLLFYDDGSAWNAISPTQLVPMGALSARPAQTTLINGTWYFAEDQVVTYIGVSTIWQRASTPAGEIAMTLSPVASPGWILLQGQAWPATTGIYADLYNQLGGPGTVPDFGGFAPVGQKTGDASFGTLAVTLGEKSHTLTDTETAAHDHTVTDPGHAHGKTDPGHAHLLGLGTGGSGSELAVLNGASSVFNQVEDTRLITDSSLTGITINSATTGITATDSTGGGGAHNNIQPSKVVNFQAKL